MVVSWEEYAQRRIHSSSADSGAARWQFGTRLDQGRVPALPQNPLGRRVLSVSMTPIVPPACNSKETHSSRLHRSQRRHFVRDSWEVEYARQADGFVCPRKRRPTSWRYHLAPTRRLNACIIGVYLQVNLSRCSFSGSSAVRSRVGQAVGRGLPTGLSIFWCLSRLRAPAHPL